MIRRWLIRSLALFLLTLCLLAWGASYFHGVQGGYNGKFEFFADLCRARIILMNASPFAPPATPGWYGTTYRITRTSWIDFDRAATCHFLGFACYALASGAFLLSAPLWFPTLLSAALLGFLWRITRPPSPAAGFPVEPPNSSSAAIPPPRSATRSSAF